jgi:hypothetical protein
MWVDVFGWLVCVAILVLELRSRKRHREEMAILEARYIELKRRARERAERN